jgi:hypothetical protein
MNYSRCLRVFPVWLVLGAFALLLSSCSPGGDPALIGKWKAKGSSQIIEIRKDGNWVEAVDASDKELGIKSSKWEWEGTNRIRLTVNTKLIGKASGVMKVTLNGDTLILKDEDGATEYTRVK